MPDTGRPCILDPIRTAQPIPPADIPDLTPAETLAELTGLIRANGQDPVTQLAGYLIADDPTFLPESGQARALARRIGRDKLLEILIELYLTSTTFTPTSDHT
jgi:uncharacterized protein (UPF0297 family)